MARKIFFRQPIQISLREWYMRIEKMEKQEEDKKVDENRERNIDDAVMQNEKKEPKNEEQDEFNILKEEIKPAPMDEKKDRPKKKQHNSIEEAITKAVKEEKEVVFVD